MRSTRLACALTLLLPLMAAASWLATLRLEISTAQASLSVYAHGFLFEIVLTPEFTLDHALIKTSADHCIAARREPSRP